MNIDQIRTIRASDTNQTSPYHLICGTNESGTIANHWMLNMANKIRCSRDNTRIEEIVLDPDYSQPGITKTRVFRMEWDIPKWGMYSIIRKPNPNYDIVSICNMCASPFNLIYRLRVSVSRL
eukprot:876499_1